LQNGENTTAPLPYPYLTHELYEPQNDKVCNYLQYLNFVNKPEEQVKIIFVPSYLNGDDGIFNLSYYDMLPGMDLTIFPSYYEPWGYTPLESVAFGVPTITTNLAGFGLWAEKEGAFENLLQGVEVVTRDDENYYEVAENIKNSIIKYSNLSSDDITTARNAASVLSEKAAWSHFIEYYYETYDIALRKTAARHCEEERRSKPERL
jgi:glycosyltransferase involved in cell wall biosynthesis